MYNCCTIVKRPSIICGLLCHCLCSQPALCRPTLIIIVISVYLHGQSYSQEDSEELIHIQTVNLMAATGRHTQMLTDDRRQSNRQGYLQSFKRSGCRDI